MSTESISTETEEKYEKYYVPEQSPWPIVGAIGLFILAFGAGNFIQQTTGKYVANEGNWGWIVMAFGFGIIIYMLWQWWKDAIRESKEGLYSAQMDRSFRMGMAWFIFSEVMFFAAFFGALFYIRVFALPWLDGEGEKGISALLWPDFSASWPLLKTPSDAFLARQKLSTPGTCPC